MKKAIKKQWCVFGGFWKDSIGKITDIYEDSVEILYSEGQMYPTELWDKHYVKRFDLPEEAVNYVAQYDDCGGREHALKVFKQNFPSVKNIK